MTDPDALLERQIAVAHARWLGSPMNRELWQQFINLHAHRSPEQVAKMEREKGIE